MSQYNDRNTLSLRVLQWTHFASDNLSAFVKSTYLPRIQVTLTPLVQVQSCSKTRLSKNLEDLILATQKLSIWRLYSLVSISQSNESKATVLLVGEVCKLGLRNYLS